MGLSLSFASHHDRNSSGDGIMALLDSLFGQPLFVWFGLVTGVFFLISVISSPVFRQPKLMKYHMKVGKFTILFGFIHMLFALAAVFFGFFI